MPLSDDNLPEDDELPHFDRKARKDFDVSNPHDIPEEFGSHCFDGKASEDFESSGFDGSRSVDSSIPDHEEAPFDASKTGEDEDLPPSNFPA